MFTDILNGINSPMNVIKSLVELLRNYDFNANETQDIVNNIIDTTKKIIHISEDVQRFIELEVSDININIDTADVNLLISEAVNKNIDEIKRKNITMKINIAPEVTTIKLDAQKITIVLHNLINNAVKFTNNNGKISINCYPKNNSVIFEVADTGIGIDQEDLKKIYENMEASDCLAISNNNGTIGLLIVKKYIEAHNGNVLVSSVLGKGSTFSFNVPLNIN
ncbi:Alkaline phosphatase synthesis sensor protein PhoR [bioreactor metagenome]|uniref:histidine kinase n=1 Tax=bioreactor metagenome TaxID=1076179 RepID=A0A645FQG5_9ZZZZ